MLTNRRGFLKGLALAGGGLVLSRSLPSFAAPVPNRKFLFAYMEGGWDTLLSLDPRDPATTRPDTHGIETGYGQLSAEYQRRGLQRRGELTFGPIVPAELLTHADRISVVNGVGMDTAAHEVGRRYFITGRFPRGLQAVGSSTGAEIVAQQGESSTIPYLSAAVESYSRDLPGFASPLEVNGLEDLLTALTPFAAVDPEILAAVQKYQDDGAGCESERLDRDGVVGSLLANQKRARTYIESDLARIFDLRREDVEMVALRELFGISGEAAAQTDSPEMLGFAAAQALKSELAQCVSVRVARGLDTHSNWAQDQPAAQERGWKTVAAILTDLSGTPSPRGGSLLDETTVLVFSEFGRTPMFNNLRGRDHHLGSSCLLAGAGIKGGRTIGRSATVGMMPLYAELATGAVLETAPEDKLSSGEIVTLSPKHVLATLFASAGLDYSHLRAEPIKPLLA
ncbi:MAG: DUF1501 domain-containing protein [Deltaproteobacteria bacterium]|nr:DUF1501 domain-containing protein [Deltaproteobacteria bacterium]